MPDQLPGNMEKPVFKRDVIRQGIKSICQGLLNPFIQAGSQKIRLI